MLYGSAKGRAILISIHLEGYCGQTPYGYCYFVFWTHHAIAIITPNITWYTFADRFTCVFSSRTARITWQNVPHHQISYDDRYTRSKGKFVARCRAHDPLRQFFA